MNESSSDSRLPAHRRTRDCQLLHGVDWAVQVGAGNDVMLATLRRVRRRRRRRLAFASAGILAIAILSARWISSPRESAIPAGIATPAAIVSMPASQTLPDGSTIELNEGAEVTVAFTQNARRVILVRGEAYFEVAMNERHPFVVDVSGIEVRAVGTAFCVQLGETAIDVVVTEGRVAVEHPSSNLETSLSPVVPIRTSTTPLLVDAGNLAVMDVVPIPGSSYAAAIHSMSQVQLRDRLAWRIPRFEFTHTPLAEAVSVINRHSQELLVLGDVSLGTVRVSGILRADNIEILLELLEAEHGITAERRPDRTIVLKR